MSVSKHNLWKKKKNGLNKLVRSDKEWRRSSNHMKFMFKNQLTIDKQK